MRSQQEIVDMIENGSDEFDSFFGFYVGVLIPFLDFETARPLLKDDYVAKVDAGEEQWTQIEPTRDNVLKEMQEYMDFGWGKAQDHRGLSAGRTIEKMDAWAWLLGDDALRTKIREADYAQYGAPKLKAICDHLGWPLPDDEDLQRMMQSQPCEPGCSMGCGS